MRKNKWVKVGIVGVDSGQVMICDPCYIESQWHVASATECPIPPEIWRDKKTGKTYACALHFNQNHKADHLFANWESPLKDYGGMTPNELRSTWWELVKFPGDTVLGEFSYPGVCHTTLTQPGFGQLRYKLGHPGAGVVSRTYSGDGSYPVLAEVDRHGRVLRMMVDFTVYDCDNDMTAADVKKEAKS